MPNPCYPVFPPAAARPASAIRRAVSSHHASNVGQGHHLHHAPVHTPPVHHAPSFGPPAPPIAADCARVPGALPAGPGLAVAKGAAPVGSFAGLAAAGLFAGATALAAAGGYMALGGGGGPGGGGSGGNVPGAASSAAAGQPSPGTPGVTPASPSGPVARAVPEAPIVIAGSPPDALPTPGVTPPDVVVPEVEPTKPETKPSNVPEPASLGLFGAGMALAWAAVRLRRRNAASR